jgi:hypothetical protein
MTSHDRISNKQWDWTPANYAQGLHICMSIRCKDTAVWIVVYALYP